MIRLPRVSGGEVAAAPESTGFNVTNSHREVQGCIETGVLGPKQA
jgi:hypothetical protein